MVHLATHLQKRVQVTGSMNHASDLNALADGSIEDDVAADRKAAEST